MPDRRRNIERLARTARTGSWMAMLAATTLGDGADTVHAEVKADGLPLDERYRLVVQTYEGRGAELPGMRAKPIGSAQRSVTSEDLARGVHVDLVELRRAAHDPVVVAWLEAGEPDLEFDGRQARPTPGSVYGIVKRDVAQRDVRISLKRRVAGKLAA
jgi:hypothetical protein